MTSDGRPKITQLIDCSGSGDVDMSTIIKETLKKVHPDDGKEYSTLQGLSGRTLYLSPTWTNPSNTWRLGLKHTNEIFCNALKGRLSKESKEVFDQKHHQLVTRVGNEANELAPGILNLNLSSVD